MVVSAYGLSETVPFAVVSQGLHRPAAFLGILISAQGVGAVAAGLVAAPLMRRLTEGLLAGLGMISAAVGFLLLIPAQLPAVLAGSALLGASLPWIIIGMMTLFQRRTPPELMGRTNAAFTLAYALPQTMAIALGAGLIGVLNYRILLLAIAGLMALAAGYLCTRREQRPDRGRAAAAGHELTGARSSSRPSPRKSAHSCAGTAAWNDSMFRRTSPAERMPTTMPADPAARAACRPSSTA